MKRALLDAGSGMMGQGSIYGKSNKKSLAPQAPLGVGGKSFVNFLTCDN